MNAVAETQEEPKERTEISRRIIQGADSKKRLAPERKTKLWPVGLKADSRARRNESGSLRLQAGRVLVKGAAWVLEAVWTGAGLSVCSHQGAAGCRSR